MVTVFIPFEPDAAAASSLLPIGFLPRAADGGAAALDGGALLPPTVALPPLEA